MRRPGGAGGGPGRRARTKKTKQGVCGMCLAGAAVCAAPDASRGLQSLLATRNILVISHGNRQARSRIQQGRGRTPAGEIVGGWSERPRPTPQTHRSRLVCVFVCVVVCECVARREAWRQQQLAARGLPQPQPRHRRPRPQASFRGCRRACSSWQQALPRAPPTRPVSGSIARGC